MAERSDVSPIIAGDKWSDAVPVAPSKPQSMRIFGLVLLIGFGLLGGLALWSWRATGSNWRLVVGTLLVSIGTIVFLWSVVSPRTLPPVYRAWMRFGQGIGNVVSTILLGVLYLVVFTVVGGLMRIFGTDPLERRIERSKSSYWRRHSPPAAPTDYVHLS